jgi:hypothetical protein
MVGSVFAGIAATDDLRHGHVAANIVVLLASLAIVASLCTALRRHRIRLSRAEAIRAAAWTIGLFQLWEGAVVGAVFARLYGWW